MEFRHRLRELRQHTGLSLRELAKATSYTFGYLSELERGVKQPSPQAARRLDDALHAGGELVDLATPPPALDSALFDDPDHVDQRRRRMSTSNVDDAKLQYLDETVMHLISEYERRPPATMAPQVRHLRRYVDQMLTGRQHPPQRERLYAIAVRLGGLLSALALDLGWPVHARAYGEEAFDLAEAAGVPDLQGWARAAQSLIAYYTGDYHEALAYARDGQRRARNSPHRIRLAVNGEARALARLGDPDGVDEAVGRAFTWLADHPSGQQVSPSMSLGPYCPARVGANAATAYLALRRTASVERYGAPALAAFDRAGLRGPQALTRLDLATAALTARDRDPDPDRAADLVMEAMTVTEAQRFESVTKRAEEFMEAAQPWSKRPRMKEIADLVADRTGQS
jgi:transcriptional regulator with XRE-family HTH domain